MTDPVDTATLTERLKREATAIEGVREREGSLQATTFVVALLREADAALSSLETRLEEAERDLGTMFQTCLEQVGEIRAAEAREKALSEALKRILDAEVIDGATASIARAALVGVRGEEKEQDKPKERL